MAHVVDRLVSLVVQLSVSRLPCDRDRVYQMLVLDVEYLVDSVAAPAPSAAAVAAVDSLPPPIAEMAEMAGQVIEVLDVWVGCGQSADMFDQVLKVVGTFGDLIEIARRAVVSTYFGPVLGEQFVGRMTRLAVPPPMLCSYCECMILPSDYGSVYLSDGELDAYPNSRAIHYECEIRMSVGSISHQTGTCGCPGWVGTCDRGRLVAHILEADPEIKHQAARAAAQHYHHVSGIPYVIVETRWRDE